MAQHDYNLSNNTGALFRADNNAALQAIVTQNSGTTAPAVTFPGMLWLDLSGGGDGVMRRRNQANTAWLTDIGQDQVARDAAAAAQATANAAMPKTGGTFTGAINLPATTPTNNQAVSRAAADALYQVMLPATQAGALLYGSASGWTGMLPPAANDTVLVLSGGLPTWATGAVTAVPNAYVRTRPDGTLDPTLIPSVASGLRFRGTFKPAVNAEYPTTGGSGAGGAPAVGDFWVIDGLTTGGYTYLTGSLAGVTVYNGDSIAKSDGTTWYRMGSSVQLDGYMRTDGSTAMTGDLNLAAHSLIEVGGIVARAGTPVPLNNFTIDATNIVISPQRGVSGPDLPAMVAGRIGTDLGRMQLWVGAGSVNFGLVPVRYFTGSTGYAAGEYVFTSATPQLWRARAAVAAGAFTESQWWKVIDEANATFSENPTVSRNIPAIIFYNTGTAVDSRRGTIGVDVSGNLALTMTNDAVTAVSGVYLARAGAHLCPMLTNGQGLGTDAARWWKLWLGNGGIDIRGAVAPIVMASDNQNTRYRILANISDAADGGLGLARWDGSGFVTYLLVKSEGVYIDTPLPYATTTTIGTAANRWTNLYLKSLIDMAGNSPALILSSAGGTYRYRAYGNISDVTDGGFVVGRWDGSAYISQLNVRLNQTYTKSVLPTDDNTFPCGAGSNRWTSIWATSGTVSTSDEREKTPFNPVTTAEHDAAQRILEIIGSYSWLSEGEGAPLNFGAGAQHVNAALMEAGLAPDRYGMVTHDVWDAVPPEYNADGSLAFPARDAGDRYGLVYEQLAMLLCANLHKRLRALESAQPLEE